MTNISTPAPSDANRTALFAGTFDPFTVGHAALVARALPLFDTVIIGVGVNAQKQNAQSGFLRVREIMRIFSNMPEGRVKVIAYENELTVDVAKRLGAGWLLRGVRNARDFEYERDMADINRRLTGIETVILFTQPEHAAISSSLVRELQSYGYDTSQFVP